MSVIRFVRMRSTSANEHSDNIQVVNVIHKSLDIIHVGTNPHQHK